MSRPAVILMRIALLAVFLGAWEFLPRAGIVNPMLLPPLSEVLETLGDYAGKTKDLVFLSEYVRHRLARTISTRYRDAEGRLHVLTLDPALEDKVAAGIEHTERGLFIRTSPQTVEKICDKVSAELKQQTEQGISRVKEALNGQDANAIRQASDDLGQTIQKIGGSMYQQEGAQQAGPDGGAAPQGGSGPSGEDVVEGDFKEG